MIFARKPSLFLLSVLPVVLPAVAPDHAVERENSLRIFKETVRPYLMESCVECHGGEKIKSGFDILTRDSMIAGGDLDVGLVVGDADESPLIWAITHEVEPEMPPKKPKTDEAIIEQVKQWINTGAVYDAPLLEMSDVDRNKPMEVTDSDRDYWAFVSLKKPALPEVGRVGWDRTPIDRFILRKLEDAGVDPSEKADRRTLIRRAYFDLIGLPPEPEAVKSFVQADNFYEAWEALIDELLANPHFGERWARHWLDPSRFAESHGFEHDYNRKYAYHYRDFVIQAFNRDMPYDKFLRYQVAGDEIAPEKPLALMATGFLGAGVYPTQITTKEAERVRYDAMDDMVATVGNAMLGLTIACARCHDHKYDPIPTADYHRILSVFTKTVRSEVEVCMDEEASEEVSAKLMRLQREHNRYAKNWKSSFEKWHIDYKAAGSPAFEIKKEKDRELIEGVLKNPEKLESGKTEKKFSEWFLAHADPVSIEMKSEIDGISKQYEVSTVQITADEYKPMRRHVADQSIPDYYEKTYHLNRGDVNQKEDEALPGVLAVLDRYGEGNQPWSEGFDAFDSRTMLAKWITETDGGAGALAARVMVNRLWHYHMGEGIVSTLNDFGFQGEAPSHPDLLEWLAADLVEGGWKLKSVHKKIMMSRAYMLSHVAADPDSDPDNNLFGRWNRRRLEAEIIRDNLLATGGILDAEMYGPGTLDESMKRRSIYFLIKRSALIPSLQIFDWPDSLSSAGARNTTTVSPQALFFMNSPQVMAAAEGFAERIRAHAGDDLKEAVSYAYELAFARKPAKKDIKEAVSFIQSYGKGKGLITYAKLLMSTNEFIYVQ